MFLFLMALFNLVSLAKKKVNEDATKLFMYHLCRFPDDVYDRIWTSWTFDGIVVNTTLPVDANGLPLMPPSAVMQTALSPTVLGSLTYLSSLFTVLNKYPNADIVLNLYFADIDPKSTATSRAFNISLDANFPMVTENPYADAGGALKADVKSLIGWGQYTNLGITLIPLPTSTDPPLLNAVEILVPNILSQATTNATDGKDLSLSANYQFQYLYSLRKSK